MAPALAHAPNRQRLLPLAAPDRGGLVRRPMTFMRVYLAVYFLLVIGAGVSLWQAGILAHVPVAWLLVALGLSVGAGVLLALTSGRRPASPE